MTANLENLGIYKHSVLLAFCLLGIDLQNETPRAKYVHELLSIGISA